MKRIEFKAKYHDSKIEIKLNLLHASSLNKGLSSEVNWIIDVCRELQFEYEFSEIRTSPNTQLYYIFDPQLRAREIPLRYRYEDVFSDWKSVCETEQKEKYKELELLLRRNGIETESFTEVTNNPEYLKHIKASGYIQALLRL